jgi:hypothetical protein
MANKQAHLASDLITGKSAMEHISADVNKLNIVDLDLGQLPQHIDQQDIKRIAGVKHVIDATVDVDNMKGICTGTGNVKLRISDGESLD